MFFNLSPAFQVVDGNQRILQTGALTISVVDAAQPGSAAPAAAAAPTAPATPPPLPAGKLYPDLYKGDSSSSSDSEGEGSTESSTGAAGGSSIVAAVGELAWELLPASHTLKVPPRLASPAAGLLGACSLLASNAVP